MYGNELRDKDVVGLNGWKIGKSRDVMVNPMDWRITDLEIELRGNIENELGMDSIPLAHNRFPISITFVQGVADLITLKITKEELVANLASYKRSQDLQRQPAKPATSTQPQMQPSVQPSVSSP